MLETVKQILKFYVENQKIPSLWDLNLSDDIKALQDKKWSVFVTLYKSWEICGSMWNIMPIEANFIDELIKSTVEAIIDKRYTEITILDVENIKIRIDLIKNKKLLDSNQVKISTIKPLKTWIIAIKNNYEKLAVVLPNISISIKDWVDLYKVLNYKLDEEFKETNYILYEFETTTFTDF